MIKETNYAIEDMNGEIIARGFKYMLTALSATTDYKLNKRDKLRVVIDTQ